MRLPLCRWSSPLRTRRPLLAPGRGSVASAARPPRRSTARPAASGARGRETSARRATRRSIRSTPATSATWRFVWRYKTGNLGPRPDYNLQSTPLVIDGVLYTTAGSRRSVVALDAATGEHLWMYRLDEGERAARSMRRLSGRGVGYWTDGAGDERIYFVTIGYQLVALDAATGRPIPRLRRRRHRRPEAAQRPGPRPHHGRAGLERRPGGGRRHRHRRRREPPGRLTAEPPQRQGLRARLRRPDRRAPLDLPHHPAAGGVRPRDMAGRILGVHRQHRRLDPDDGRRRARHRVPAGRDPDRRLLRRGTGRATTSSPRAS